MQVNVFGIGDVVGKPGKQIIKAKLPRIIKEEGIDLVIANGENISGGSGIVPKDADELLSIGIDVITCGDHVWSKKEIVPYIYSSKKVLRPANYPSESPGLGATIVETQKGILIGVIHVQGRTFMKQYIDCPFKTAKRIAENFREKTKIIVVDMHAEATSEKIALGWYLDGLVSFIFGTHTHIQTADERILPRGTAYITDIGMTGPFDSILGRKVDKVLYRFLTQMPSYFDVATDDVHLCGAIATIDTGTGIATGIKRFNISDSQF
jgi:hypothetical protein